MADRESRPGAEAEEPIRNMRREGKEWSEVCDWITRHVGYDTEIVHWARNIYNDEAARERKRETEATS